MTVFTVTTAADVVDGGDGVLSLREAVQQANATAAADRIVFADALEGGRLTLSRGQLALTADATIDGDRDGDGTGVTVSGGGASRVLLIGGTGTDASLEAVTIADGREAAAAGGGVRLAAGNSLVMEGCTLSGNQAESGGGIYAAAGSRLAVTTSTFTGNATIYDASGVGNGGGLRGVGGAAVTIDRVSFTGNSANAYGGAISIEDGSSLSLARSQVAGNGAGTFYAGVGDGAGLHLDRSSARITDSAIVSNSRGGILAESSEVTLVDSTVADNTKVLRYGLFGGAAGISAEGDGQLSLVGCTVTGNTVGSSYGNAVVSGISATRLHIANSIVAGNTQDQSYRSDLGADVIVSNGHNIFGTDVAGSAEGDLENVAATRLFAVIDGETRGGQPAANGGPTFTVALRDALDNPALSGAEPIAAGDQDQRGAPRPQPMASNPDIGSFELDQSAVSTTASRGNDVLAGTAGADSRDGLAGADLLRGLGGNDRLSGGEGGDTLRGGPGDDSLFGNAGQDTASYRDATGAVSVSLVAGTATGALGRDTLAGIENLEGGGGSDSLTGNALANLLAGREGADRLLGREGADVLLGATGDDLLAGGLGRDALIGGRGDDLFDYDRLVASTVGAGRDRIADFTHAGDRIDLSGIDARSGTAADDAFLFRAAEGAAFTAAGQVRWFHAGGDTFVEANVDADLRPDLQVQLDGSVRLSAVDFVF